MPILDFRILENTDDTLKLWKRNLEYLFGKKLNDDNIATTSLTLGPAQVKASNIDFGLGVDQVDASDIPIIDASSYYSGGTVELALSQLGSTFLNIPSENVKIVDASSYFTSTSVEGALFELYSTITNIPSSNLDLSFVAPLNTTSTNIVLNYNTKNLKVGTSSELDTIQNIATTDSPTFVNLTVTSTIQALTGKFGNSSDYSEFEADGTLKFNGNATVFDDVIGSALRLSVVGVGLAVNNVENTLDYSTASDLNDYAYDNYQFSHKRKLGTRIYPHVHWIQKENNKPNFLIRFRWQITGQPHTTTWSDCPLLGNVYTYTVGSLHQISYSTGLASPSTDDISGVIQLRVFRDNANASGAFATTNLYSTTVSIMFVDIHNEIDTVGSRAQYTK